MRKMKLYLCGPVSLGGTLTIEEEQANFQRFYDAEADLIAAGYQVENPLKHLEFCKERLPVQLLDDGECPPEGVARWQWIMRRTVIQMLTCQGIAVLPKAEQSRGAVRELSIGIDFGLPIKNYLQWLYAASLVPLPNPMVR